MKQKAVLFFLIGLLPFLTLGQSDEPLLLKKQVRKQRPTYIELGSGLNYISFRDFATSPLFYSGVGGTIALSALKTDQHRESVFGFTVAGGNYTSIVGTHSAESLMGSFFLNYSRLFQLKKWSSSKINFKAGGMLNVAMNVRYNETFRNSSTGIEMIPTLFGSAKTSFDISRKSPKESNIWFIKYKLNSRKMKLSYQINVGLLNSSYRNGFIYNNQSALLNNNKIFEGYVFSAFSGFRMNASLDYTLFLKNKNALKLAYVWDAYKTGGDLDKLEFANHSIQFALLFNTK